MAVYKWEADIFKRGDAQARGSKSVRVAAYCRVSTDEQDSSYQAQKKHICDVLRQHPDWTLARIYADEGISGTGVRHRKEFLRMLRDCERGSIDLIITKSVSRFARNTVDMLITVRKLRDLHVNVIFEQENLDTRDLSNELFLTFWASFAQAESVSISKNVVAGLRGRMERGEGRINWWSSIGYEKTGDRLQLRMVADQAVLVRRIYRAYLDGFSNESIARQLEAAGIPAPQGGSRWYGSTVGSILQNQKYMGDLLFQKTYTKDTLTHQIEVNRGQLPQYYLEGNHEPIIPREIFYLVQGQRLMRAAKRRTALQESRGSESFRGRVQCGICGRVMKQVLFPDGRVEWRCVARSGRRKSETKEHLQSCSCPAVSEEILRWAFVCAIGLLPNYQMQIAGEEKQLEQDRAEDRQVLRERLEQLEHAEKRKATYQEKLELYAADTEDARRRRQLRMLRVLSEVVNRQWIPVEDTGEPCRDAGDFYLRTDRLEMYAQVDWSGIRFQVSLHWKGTPTGQTKHTVDGETRTRTGVWMAVCHSQLNPEVVLPQLASDEQVFRLVDHAVVDREAITMHFYGGIGIRLPFTGRYED